MGAPEATAGLKPGFGRGAGLRRKPVSLSSGAGKLRLLGSADVVFGS